MKYFVQSFIIIFLFGQFKFIEAKITSSQTPNIIFILADDLGYGDVEILNEQSKIPTPHLNKLAQQGMVFTHAHAPSAVCTPTRYSILTGSYSWRSSKKSGVAWLWDPPIIDKLEDYTLGDMLQSKGYHTACIGKWHLGWQWPTIKGMHPNWMEGILITRKLSLEGLLNLDLIIILGMTCQVFHLMLLLKMIR